jgi:hypothetical protein
VYAERLVVECVVRLFLRKVIYLLVESKVVSMDGVKFLLDALIDFIGGEFVACASPYTLAIFLVASTAGLVHLNKTKRTN